MSGSLYVFSGLDGSGKSTQIDRFAMRLRAEGRNVVVLWSRGGYTPGMVRLKTLLRSISSRATGRSAIPDAGPSAARTQAFQNGLVRWCWQTMAVLDLIGLYCGWIRWKLWTGTDVICDRYWPDTELDFLLNFPSDAIGERWLWRWLRRCAPRPKAGFLLLIPVDVSVQRSAEKQEPFPDEPAVLQRRLDWYKAIATNDESKTTRRAQPSWHVLDGTQSIDEVAEQIAAMAAAGEKPHRVACP